MSSIFAVLFFNENELLCINFKVTRNPKIKNGLKYFASKNTSINVKPGWFLKQIQLAKWFRFHIDLFPDSFHSLKRFLFQDSYIVDY